MKKMTVVLLVVVLVILTTAIVACGGLTRDQTLTLAKAKVQEEGWRPLYGEYIGNFVVVIACPQEGEARGVVHALLVNRALEVTATDAVAGATCEPIPAATPAAAEANR